MPKESLTLMIGADGLKKLRKIQRYLGIKNEVNTVVYALGWASKLVEIHKQGFKIVTQDPTTGYLEGELDVTNIKEL